MGGARKVLRRRGIFIDVDIEGYVLREYLKLKDDHNKNIIIIITIKEQINGPVEEQHAVTWQTNYN